MPENAIYIHSNIVDGENDSDVLQEIYSNNSIPFSLCTYINPDPIANSKKLLNNKMRNVSFSITNEYNQPLFLNGEDVLLTIMLYRDADYFEKSLVFNNGIKEFIKYVINRNSEQDRKEEQARVAAEEEKRQKQATSKLIEALQSLTDQPQAPQVPEQPIA